jgi:hypothetical protein
MASTIAAVTTSGGGVVTTADASGNLNLLAGTTTVVAITTAGAAVTGTLSATGITTVAAGSAALPAIVSTTGTADTGLWFPAADTVAASTAGAERMRIDSSGNVLVTNVAGLGYGTGAGGTVTQATSKSTGVTLNKPSGKITMVNTLLAANTNVSFILTNSLLATGDIVLVNINDGATLNSYQACAENSRGGSVYIMLRNTTGASLSEAVVLTFTIIKSVSV